MIGSDSNTYYYVGSLAEAIYGTIEKIEVVSGRIMIEQSELYDIIAAGIAGRVVSGVDCINRAAVVTNMRMAYGIACHGKFKGCKNYGNVSSDELSFFPATMEITFIGSAGISNNGMVENCHNYGEITANNTYACGITVKGEVSQCSNHGTITSMKQSAAGIGIYLTSVENCYNVGKVSGKTSSSGIFSSGASAYYCYNCGSIIGRKEAGITCEGKAIRCVNVNSQFAGSDDYEAQCYVYDGTTALFKDTLKWSEEVWAFSYEGYPELIVLME